MCICSQQDIENFKAEVEKRQKELSPSLSENGKGCEDGIPRNGGVIVTEVEDEPVSPSPSPKASLATVEPTSS